MTNAKDMRKRDIESQLDAYFTVEAALIIPLVMATIVFLMYMMFYQYNRCLMEQDLGCLLVKGSANEVQRNYEKYLMWENEEVTVTQERSILTVSQKGQLSFPFAGWQIKGVGSVWSCEAEYQGNLITPTFWVRRYEKLVENTKKD